MCERLYYTLLLLLHTILITILTCPLLFYSVLAVLGIGNGKQGFHNSRGGSPDLPQHSTCLLDDSLLDDTFASTTTGGITTPGSADCKTEINKCKLYFPLSLSLSLSLSPPSHTYSLHSTSLNWQ